MEFLKAIKSIQNKSARKKGVKAYYNSGQVFFSRLFGFERVDDRYIPIPKYAEAIKMIYKMLIDGESLPAIKAKLDADGYRDSSNNKYTLARIANVVRPIYAGYLKKGLCFTCISNIEPIISLENYKNARNKVERELQRMRTL